MGTVLQRRPPTSRNRSPTHIWWPGHDLDLYLVRFLLLPLEMGKLFSGVPLLLAGALF
ncbi:hypothetical protein M5D96_013402 [Drosophila gunungcola]|uniref:Uncharacterized protein n=1 Tax=Drosophila gunungcola TaxID=103775 RepID=A0A9P9YC49_9MUSC|nr:hypothetical protein M5D96_013402 [Drosophila gunungcola]